MENPEVPAYKLMYLDQVFLLTSAQKDGTKPHVIPQLWTMPVSFKPQRIAISVAKSRYSHHLIETTKEFVLNIPSNEMAPKVWSCAPSANGGDKFARAKLTIMKAKKVSAPLIKECLGAIECKVLEQIDAADHSIFVAEVVATHNFKGGKVLVNASGDHDFELTSSGYKLKTTGSVSVK